uniref:Uncharacterized protein n=1 Tax=Arundo donax TaxID=35708 RepID=A0A0A8YTP1_ARUDO
MFIAIAIEEVNLSSDTKYKTIAATDVQLQAMYEKFHDGVLT